ncbi:hypothetical protein NEUTE1DRAFT_88135 [Neurospora tetrasperma FGSC 2508]|uniref:Uncharacterized protein n=1 Tax=Neurospora tetrasperma (strain FGSC 2508 / ATCC MYA-4615 / P0657) TaxID=510951 RepID=F8MUZ2_NEUT8|nr:uncharacterized protein NEUTE1DRAFT_88135 [Neurospora tetrasperma FGSC 2508]EGO54617.1 hypothetical protein NEUTE1DRAFT_88135 [Neurospora tetrasperma FGSC 2508]EGZ67927.1 hypothetical protein NEUTE2DRAFT_95889 [Neurospora tetrasperma FGSC 2509]
MFTFIFDTPVVPKPSSVRTTQLMQSLIQVTTENVPPKHEGPGPVPPDSLAAESIRSGGAFAQGNPSASAGGSASQNPRAKAPGTAHQSHPEAQQPKHENPEQGAPAPTYIFHHGRNLPDPAGPHGKNIREVKEDEIDESWTEPASMPEPGSKEDPGRAALKRMLVSTAPEVKMDTGKGSQEGGDVLPLETREAGFEALGGDAEA